MSWLSHDADSSDAGTRADRRCEYPRRQHHRAARQRCRDTRPGGGPACPTRPATEKPVVLLRPAPQTIERIFTDDALRRLNERYTVIDGEADPSEEAIEACLPEVIAIIGQPDLPRERLERAPKLRGILNVEGNFFQNVDYDAAFERGVNVVACMPTYAQAVAEFSLGLAIDLARGISREDRAFREGREGYVFNSTQDSILLRGSEMGILGYGNIGRKLLPLLEPFRPSVVRCYDPWLPDAVIREAGMVPASLEEIAVDEHLPVRAGHRHRRIHAPARRREHEAHPARRLG